MLKPSFSPAPPGTVPSTWNDIFDHHDGPYYVDRCRSTGQWLLRWRCADFKSFEHESDAVGEMRRLATMWRSQLRRVYFIGEANRLGLAVKIGTTYTPVKRLRALQTASAQSLAILGLMVGGADREKGLHRKFVRSRINGEWFRITPALLQLILRNPATPEKLT